jgi:hypothetical protein
MIIASMFNFEPEQFFEVEDEAARQEVRVDFSATTPATPTPPAGPAPPPAQANQAPPPQPGQTD